MKRVTRSREWMRRTKRGRSIGEMRGERPRGMGDGGGNEWRKEKEKGERERNEI